MDIKIADMELAELSKYAKLFSDVFNGEPWNDSWTVETAGIRIENMMRTATFIGKALYINDDLKGMIWGQKEQFFDGIHFQIQEFCVKSTDQGKGCGKALLQALRDELAAIGVTNTYLITSRGERTEGYYAKRGFVTSDFMILMTDRKKITTEDIMENRIALIGIMVETPDSVAELNAILHEFSGYIKGRMGVPHAGGRIQVISVVLEAPADKINAISGRIGRLEGVTSNTIYAKQ